MSHDETTTEVSGAGTGTLLGVFESSGSKDFTVAQTEGVIRNDINTRGESSGSHCYGVVNVYGNATAIVGSSYGTSDGFGNVFAKQQQPASLDFSGLESELGSIVIEILKLFDTSKTSVREFRRLKTAYKYAFQISVQKTIFKTAIQALLLPYTGADIAEKMLLDPRHLNWTTEGMLGYLRYRLGDGVPAVRHLLELIESDLLAVAGFIRDRIASGSKSTQVSTKVRQLTQDVVDKALKDLKSHVVNFQTHLQQRNQQQGGAVHVAQLCDESKSEVTRCKRIQEAAQDLYHAFARACEQHPKHRARLHLQALSRTPFRVQFSLLLEQSGALNSVTSISDTDFWRLTIETQISDTSKRTRQAPDDDDETKNISATRQKRVAPAPSTKLVALSSMPRVRGRETFSRFPNFCINAKFCAHLKNILSHGTCGNKAFGYLQNQGCPTHLVCFKSRTQTQAPKQNFASTYNSSIRSGSKLLPLRNFFQSVQQDDYITKADLCSFAKQLAVAVLQYHDTPWFGSWDSNHVLIDHQGSFFRQSKSAANDIHTNCPSDSYLEVSIEDPDTTARTPITGQSRTFIRNWTVFRLGVMLLEVAYQRPLRDLQEPDDIDSRNEHNTDYFTADRLCKRVAAKMGSVYAEVVRKCIQCDFSHGADLTAPELQEGFYENVIQKLEEIETGMKDLGL